MAVISKTNESRLTAEYVRSVLSYDPEAGLFRWKKGNSTRVKTGDIAGYIRPDGRRAIKIGYTRYLASRLAWLYINDEWPDCYVDHIDRNTSNDAIANLRLATEEQNHWNRGVRKTQALGFKNIVKHKRRFVVHFARNRQALYRKSFPTLEEAIEARNARSALIYGAFSPISPDQ